MPRTWLQALTVNFTLAMTIATCFLALVHGQTQDFINGSVTSELHALTGRIEVIESGQRYLLFTVAGALIAQLFAVITTQQTQRARRKLDSSE